jgi:type IV secretion system protein VirB3
MARRTTPIYRALHRPKLILGGEREVVLVGGLLAAGTAMVGLTLPALVVGGVIWALTISAARLMAKADPQMSRVYFRHLRFQRYYPARSLIWHEKKHS